MIGLSAPAAFAPLPRIYSRYAFLLEDESNPEGLSHWNIPKNRNRDLPGFSARSQPTAPPRPSTCIKSDSLFQVSKGTHVILLSPVWCTLVSSASKIHFNNIQQHGRCFRSYIFLSRKFLMHLSPVMPYILPSAESPVKTYYIWSLWICQHNLELLKLLYFAHTV
jgi:hypothetical protein